MIIEWTIKKQLFRNENHAVWFIISMWLLVVSCANLLFPKQPIIFLLPVLLHGTALLQATYSIISQKQSNTLSQDCIWFNALLVVMYGTLFVAAKYIFSIK